MPPKHPDAPTSRVFTRCEHCRAVLPVGYEALGHAGGMVRCGSCGQTLNALAQLYPGYPDGSVEPISASGMPPMLQPIVRQEQIVVSPTQPGSDDKAAEISGEMANDTSDRRGPILRLDLEPEPASAGMRLLWPALAVLLAAALALQFAGPERWRLDLAVLGFGPDEPVAVAHAVQVVSRDMHAHPSLDDALVISAVLVNRSARPVPWPSIELKLFDASQQTIGRRRIEPADYLAEDADLQRGFAPDLRLPVVLEMTVESSTPTGFSMSFHN